MARISRLQQFIKISFIVILIAVFGIYGFYKTKNLILGPDIEILSPKNGNNISNSYITIEGAAKRVSNLYLNGRKIFTDENGNFKENLLMAQGYNIIELSAEDIFRRKVKEIREIILK